MPVVVPRDREEIVVLASPMSFEISLVFMLRSLIKRFRLFCNIKMSPPYIILYAIKCFFAKKKKKEFFIAFCMSIDYNVSCK